MPVTREPTAVSTEPTGVAAPMSCMCSTSGSSTTWKPVMLARIQPGRSTTATFPPSGSPGNPVTWRTGSATAAACCRSSATTLLAPARLTCGPGLTHLMAVDSATFQSIIWELLTPTPYVAWRPVGHAQDAVLGATASGLCAAASGQGSGELREHGFRPYPKPLRDVIAH